MDFYQIKERASKNGLIEVYPDFKICRSKDLMVRGGKFYAIWDEENQIWSTDEYYVQTLVDKKLWDYRNRLANGSENSIKVRLMSEFSSKVWSEYRSYINHLSDNYHQLDESLTFANTEVKKKDYVSKRLPYSLEKGSIENYETLMNVLYKDEERQKIEWAIGAIISGDAKNIQKFMVLYGEHGTGKSTVLNIIEKLFEGYTKSFDAKNLTGNNSFSLEDFKDNPLVAINHDGDLSKIEDNSRLNSLVSHEKMSINEKFKSRYEARINSFLFVGTNKPVKITDGKSGVIRRLIDVRPSGNTIPIRKYNSLASQIEFELGAIAYHCLERYRDMGKNYYSTYKPLEMIYQTDVFFNYVEEYSEIFIQQDGVTLSQAYEMYKRYCDETLLDFKLPRHKFRDELKNYFKEFNDIARVDGKQVRSYYSKFLKNKFKNNLIKDEKTDKISLDQTTSILDEICKDYPAQYANNDIPSEKWDNVKTKLKDIDTSKTHYLKPPGHHIVMDFDLKDENGNKSPEKNLEAASKFPTTYAEYSKSGGGIHLHYYYDGDTSRLSRIYSEGIEIKVFSGKSSLRRKFTKCNNIPIRTINSGLPLKGEKMINFEVVRNEKVIRELIRKNLNKEIHPATKPSIDFIYKILEDSYNAGVKYDITDMRPAVMNFANNSTHQADYCLKLIPKMKFRSEEISIPKNDYISDDIVFYDVEVFPNLFVVCWKYAGKPCVKMINPTGADLEDLFKFKLVGFNCRRYDNHIMYARYIGYDNYQLYLLSQKLVNNESRNCTFGEAYNLSYTDIYDFASPENKKSLKKFEIELGIHHQELGMAWNEPVPQEHWDKVADYCCNDVIATEATFNYLSGDWAARKILTELSGLTVNDTTNNHTIKIIFGNNKKPQSEFVYTDLSTMFPGYKYENGISTYRGLKTGEGGYVYAEPGIHRNVALLDITSMHPTSMEQLNLFGPYTKIFSELKSARVAVKRNDIESLKTLLGGKIFPFAEAVMNGTADFTMKDLAKALKEPINSAYGLTYASFDNPFRDPRNIDNIVAKRGALFMIDLLYAVKEQGYQVAHIKTDSIKVPNADEKIIKFINEFGKKYGYNFEHEATYDRLCLVNDAVYIAKNDKGWTATGAQFAQPYVFKTLFSKEPLEFKDLCETKTVQSALYLDMNESNEEEHNLHFVGKVGLFTPLIPGAGGGILLRESKNQKTGEVKYDSASGAKGYRWMESEMVIELKKEKDVNYNYFNNLANKAIEEISKYGDFEMFVNN